jgi:hypothetical protein
MAAFAKKLAAGMSGGRTMGGLSKGVLAVNRMINRDRMIKLTPGEVTALKELAAAGPRGRTSRAVRRDLARLIQAHYVIERSAKTDTVIYVITDLGRRALAD